MDFRDGDYSAQPCPTGDRPLHHFVYQSEISKPRQHSVGIPDSESGFTWIDEQCFRCSFLPCSAKLAIRLKSPRLIPVWVNQLVTKSVIKTRAERAMASDPERFEGHGVPLPINVLVNLRLYIQNAVDEPDKSRRIFGHNKKFMLSLGESCADLLEYIGFVREVLALCSL